ncbi:hypothetical protein LRP52_23975 [Photobacterium sp. ZSDE20]|uniref:Uncharacterized protein n=1 Tax=Photobacterium pectinilyticum TaxID=2906793 RepID=A0ABT1N138_9GAMM|nr:hypothetical protein [Photobacterium sp. ZSDE20]MCQ1058384.1 hypothetical protein [Photobacterium sp. ZSDE20]MDD1825253.1 hypothetical protein [Photobacterium sp. ZSDE20]
MMMAAHATTKIVQVEYNGIGDEVVAVITYNNSGWLMVNSFAGIEEDQLGTPVEAAFDNFKAALIDQYGQPEKVTISYGDLRAIDHSLCMEDVDPNLMLQAFLTAFSKRH